MLTNSITSIEVSRQGIGRFREDHLVRTFFWRNYISVHIHFADKSVKIYEANLYEIIILNILIFI